MSSSAEARSEATLNGLQHSTGVFLMLVADADHTNQVRFLAYSDRRLRYL